MTQTAIVTNVFSNGMALVRVERTSACGGNCAHCGACKYQNKITTQARNRISAKVGDKVIIQSSTSQIIRAAALVYFLPLITFFAGCFGAMALSLGEGWTILAGFLGLAVGLALVYWINRSRRPGDKIEFEIIDFDRL
jgi:sigma-E factor negative regulatory protein RseC